MAAHHSSLSLKGAGIIDSFCTSIKQFNFYNDVQAMRVSMYLDLPG